MNEHIVVEIFTRIKGVKYTLSKFNDQKRSSIAIKDNINKYIDIIFSVNSPICIERVNELRKQEVINEPKYKKTHLEDTVRKLAWDNVAVDDEIIIGKGAGEFLGIDFQNTCCKEKF